MNKELTEQLIIWYKANKYTEIINAIEKLPQSEWNYDLKGTLSRAYVSKSKNEKALEILLSESLNGNNDPLWNYRVGFAYFHNNDHKKALPYFQRCTELGDLKDGHTDFFTKRCIEEIRARTEREKTMLSITAYNLDVRSEVDGDYSYVTVGVTWKNKKYLEVPTKCNKTQVMWSHESAYGVVGSKVGDFISHYGESSSLQEGIFTHRHIAEMLIKKFTGLKSNEVIWVENPLEKTLSTGMPRLKKAKWLPEKEVDLVHLYSDEYIDVCNPKPIKTDFFNIFRLDGIGKKSYQHTWLMCTEETEKKLSEMNFTCLYIKKSTIWGQKN